MIIEKEISVALRKLTVYSLIFNQTCMSDPQPLFLSLSSITPSAAVILFVVFVTMFRKGSGHLSYDYQFLMHFPPTYIPNFPGGGHIPGPP